jgi:hypothetical protein
MDQSLTAPIREKIRYHKQRIKDHEERIRHHREQVAKWDGILSQIQSMQREEQPRGRAVKQPAALVSIWLPENSQLPENRAKFARQILAANAKDGVLPGRIRSLANEAKFSCPTNYPYKLLANMVKRGEARKDEEGRYYPIIKNDSEKQAAAKRLVRLED